MENTAYPYPILVSYANVEEGLAYNFTRAMLTHFNDYAGAAPGNNGWAFDRQRFDWAVPYHSAAIKALREAGAWKPEHDAHNDSLIRRQQMLAEAWTGYNTSSAPQDSTAFTEGWMKARASALSAAKLSVVFEN